MESIYKTILNNLYEENQCAMLTYLNFNSDSDGHVFEKIIITRKDLEDKSLQLNDHIYDKIQLSISTGKPEMIGIEENKYIFVEPFFPKPHLYIFGGGHISKPLSEFAARVGFSVTIIDDRPSFANAQRFKAAEKVICESFKKSFSIINLRKSDFVVIVTRGHKHDGEVLKQVLDYNLKYVGMIGSKRRVQGMFEQLLNEGYTREKLASINAPIGLDIGAVSPDEIAISIAAQLIYFKNKTNNSGETFFHSEFDDEVIKELSRVSEIPRFLITILSSKGSVPRKAGAKMVVYIDGRTIGSIGGGCSEAAVISKTRELTSNKGFLIEHIDMTNDVAESEGMVCGGTMEVLIEAL